MKKKKKLPKIQSEPARADSQRKPVSAEAKKRAFFIAGLSLLNVIIYFAIVPALPPIVQFAVHIAYLAIFGAALVLYIIYNRAFTRKNITIEMLPDVWSAEKKAAYIIDGEERLKKSRWLMYIIIPFLVPIGIDALYLFVWEAYLKGIVMQIVGGLS